MYTILGNPSIFTDCIGFFVFNFVPYTFCVLPFDDINLFYVPTLLVFLDLTFHSSQPPHSKVVIRATRIHSAT